MNVSQLANSVYSNAGLNINELTYTNQAKGKETAEVEQSTTAFSQVLSDLIRDDTVSSTETVEELLETLDSLETNSSHSDSLDAMDILTDSEKAKEYLSSQSGRQVIIELAKNSIAEIISDSNK